MSIQCKVYKQIQKQFQSGLMPKRMLLKCSTRCLIKNHAAQSTLQSTRHIVLECFFESYVWSKSIHLNGKLFTDSVRMSQAILATDFVVFKMHPWFWRAQHTATHTSILGHSKGKSYQHCHSSSKVSHSHTVIPLSASPLGSEHLIPSNISLCWWAPYNKSTFLWASLLNP